jgi:hypothetical protein
VGQQCVAVVRGDDDLLCDILVEYLQAQSIMTVQILAGALGGLRVSLQSDRFDVEGNQVMGVLFRVSPDVSFSDNFVVDDQPFCNTEVGAVWLAALNLSTVLAINRLDAVAWFDGTRWPVWRRKLLQQGLPVAPFSYGEAPSRDHALWYPYGSGSLVPAPEPITQRIFCTALTSTKETHSSLVLGGKVISGHRHPNVVSAALFMAEIGAPLVEITVDDKGYVLACNTLPAMRDLTQVRQVAQSLADLFHDHMSSW